MSVLSVRLPESLHKMARDVAGEDKISLNQFIATAVAEKVAALTTEKYLESRALRGSHAETRRHEGKQRSVFHLRVSV